jgi:hypothetical protein
MHLTYGEPVRELSNYEQLSFLDSATMLLAESVIKESFMAQKRKGDTTRQKRDASELLVLHTEQELQQRMLDRPDFADKLILEYALVHPEFAIKLKAKVDSLTAILMAYEWEIMTRQVPRTSIH